MHEPLITLHSGLNSELVEAIQRSIDPSGVEERRCRRFVRNEYFADGPNHVWASDGHEKLKPYGIAIYGSIDCWSCKVLGLFAHITNSDPRHVGLWFLQIVEDVGGIPQKVTTDRGTETLDLASLQVSLGQIFSEKNTAQQEQLHHYVKSTRNQKIECFWNQMTMGVSEAMKQGIEQAISKGKYEDEDVFQKCVFISLTTLIHS